MTPKVLVGHDASGLELRMMAHFINDPEYTKVIIDKPHVYHQKLLSLDTVDAAKAFIYKFNYGAGVSTHRNKSLKPCVHYKEELMIQG